MANQWLIMVNNGQPMIAGTLLWNQQDLSKLIFAIALLFFFTVSNWAATLLLISLWNPMKSLVVDGKNPITSIETPQLMLLQSPPMHKKALEKWPVEMLERMLPRHLQRLWPKSPGYRRWNSYRIRCFIKVPGVYHFFCLYPQVCWYKRKQDWGLVKQQLQLLEYLSCI